MTIILHVPVCMYVCVLQGSVLYSYFTNGKLERTEGSSITEGTYIRAWFSVLCTCVNFTEFWYTELALQENSLRLILY